MTTLIFVLVWVTLGLGLVLIALSGGPSGAAGRMMSTSRSGRRAATFLFVLSLIVLGAVVPAYVVASVLDKDDIPAANVSDLTEAEKHGRELFGQRCANCHTLKASNAIAEVGPDLDALRPNKAVVLAAIKEGKSNGKGQMAAGLYTDGDADDVASYVAKAVGSSEESGNAAAEEEAKEEGEEP